MNKIFLFDVDGTLTPAKGKMNPEFKKEFLKWAHHKQVYLVSGGSFPRIVDQIGRDVLDLMHGVFSCMGNSFYLRMSTEDYSEWNRLYKNKFKVEKPRLFFSELERHVMNSPYHTKTGRHYEERTGMVNFSIVGRNATDKERKEYAAYDLENQERLKIVEKLSKKYLSLDFVIGGAVSIDIYEKGNDKSQVLHRHLGESLDNNIIIFTGDRVAFPGNDHSLAKALDSHPNGYSCEVQNWKDTRRLLGTNLFASG